MEYSKASHPCFTSSFQCDFRQDAELCQNVLKERNIFAAVETIMGILQHYSTQSSRTSQKNNYYQDEWGKDGVSRVKDEDEGSAQILIHHPSKDEGSQQTLCHEPGNDEGFAHTLFHDPSKYQESGHTLFHDPNRDEGSGHTLFHDPNKDEGSGHTLFHDPSKTYEFNCFVEPERSAKHIIETCNIGKESSNAEILSLDVEGKTELQMHISSTITDNVKSTMKRQIGKERINIAKKKSLKTCQKAAPKGRGKFKRNDQLTSKACSLIFRHFFGRIW